MSEGASEESGEGSPIENAGQMSDAGTAPTAFSDDVNPVDDLDEIKRKASRRRDLLVRLGTSAVLIPFIIWTIVQGGLFYLAVVVVIGLAAQHEFYGLIVDKGAKPIQSVGLGFGVAVMLVAYFGNE